MRYITITHYIIYTYNVCVDECELIFVNQSHFVGEKEKLMK